MRWEAQVAAWRLHARSSEFRRRVEAAVQVARSGAKHGKLFCSLSGGKDSVAMAGILEQAGLADRIPCVYAHCDLNLPDTQSTVEATAERLNMNLDIIEPDALEEHAARISKKYNHPLPQPSVGGWTVWDLLRCFPPSASIVQSLDDLQKACAAGNMLVAHMYAEEYAGSYVGLRAEESRGRAAYARVWGPVHQSVLDGTRQVCPLLAWTGNDVFAYLVSRELPIHPYYRAAAETFPDVPPHRLRVDLALTPDSIAARGAMAMLARVYPDFFARIASVRPEIRLYV